MASRISDRSSFAAAILENPSAKSAAVLCRRVVDRVAESKAKAVSREFVAAQAEELGVGHDVTFEGVRLRSVLERGPDSVEEWGVVVVLALHRIGEDLGTDAARARRIVREADVLESLGVDVYGWIETSVAETTLPALFDAIVAQTKDDVALGRAGRARAYARVEASRSFETERGTGARLAIANALDGSPLAQVLGSGASSAPRLAFDATALPPPRGGVLGFLRLVSGFALLAWIGRLLLRIVGIRKVAAVRVDPSSLTIESRTTFGARVLSSRVERFSREAFVGASSETRFPSIHLLVGALGLGLGLVVGGTYIGDAVRSGETYLLLVGAALILAGGLLDLGLSVLWPAARGRTVLDLVVAGGRVIRVAGVADDDARAALDWLRSAR